MWPGLRPATVTGLRLDTDTGLEEDPGPGVAAAAGPETTSGAVQSTVKPVLTVPWQEEWRGEKVVREVSLQGGRGGGPSREVSLL